MTKLFIYMEMWKILYILFCIYIKKKEKRFILLVFAVSNLKVGVFALL